MVLQVNFFYVTQQDWFKWTRKTSW